MYIKIPPTGRRPISYFSPATYVENICYIWASLKKGSFLSYLDLPWNIILSSQAPMPCRSFWGSTMWECLRARSSSWRLKTSSGTRSKLREFVTRQRFRETLKNCQILSLNHYQQPTRLLCILVHSYDYQTLDYDIMLIKLFHPVKVTESVAPIPLPTGCPYGGHMCSVSGWGKTSNDENGESTFGFLTHLHLDSKVKGTFQSSKKGNNGFYEGNNFKQ